MSDNFIDPEKVDGGGTVDPWDVELRSARRRMTETYGEHYIIDDPVRPIPSVAAVDDAWRRVRDFRADRLTDRDGRVEGVDR